MIFSEERNCALPAAVYRPRNPQSSDYYRCVEDYFETFVNIYDEHFSQQYGLMKSIPSLGKATIPRLLAELDDPDKFNHVREMVAFIGLAPRERLSGSSIKGKPRLSKIGHARLRKALYMPALMSIQCDPVMIDFYNRLKDKGKNGKVIVCAIMRKHGSCYLRCPEVREKV